MTTPSPTAPAPGTTATPPTGNVTPAPAPATLGSFVGDAAKVAGQVLDAAPQISPIIAALPPAARIKAAALKLAGELHADMKHLFSHHSVADLIEDARKIEAYLTEGIDKIEAK